MRISAAFSAAFKRMCAARSVDDLEQELSNALHHLYRLGEMCRKKMGDSSFFAAVQRTSELRGARATMWARRFDTHDAVVVAAPADMFSDFYTEMYGILAWRPLEELPEQVDKYCRHVDYAGELEGRPVLDTVHRSFAALEALVT